MATQHEAGFTDVTSRKLAGDPMHVFYIARKAR